MLLNCDLGESYGSWHMGLDEDVMPFIDQANIACGFHAGDPLTLQRTLKLAASHGVTIGAHPAYPDLVGFGRRSMALSSDELYAALHYQVAAIDGMARALGVEVSYVKPHGALYNDMMRDDAVRHTVMHAVAEYPAPLALMLQSTADGEQHQREAANLDLKVLLEAFADRCYDDDGRLLSRRLPGAVHSRERMLEQVQTLVESRTVVTAGGQRLRLAVDSVCVHGDNHEAVQAVREIRQLLSP